MSIKPKNQKEWDQFVSIFFGSIFATFSSRCTQMVSKKQRRKNMKRLMLILVALSFASLPLLSYANPSRPGHGPSHPSPGPGHGPGPHPGPGGHHNDSAELSCAPEIVSDNLTALDSNLAALSNTAEFANTISFKKEISKISAMPTAQDKVQSYFALIGIDSSNSDQVATFLGAREADPQWISNLKQATDLSDLQARRVVDTVSKSLVGELQ